MSKKLSCSECKYCHFTILGCYECKKFEILPLTFGYAIVCKGFKKKKQ